MNVEISLHAPQGALTLHREPLRQKETLRAWDAADEYVLGFLADELGDVVADIAADQDKTLVVVNDSFGALGVALAPCRPISWSDSIISHQALAANLERNGRAGSATTLANTESLPGRIDMLVIKVPKSIAQLEHQLHRLRPSLHEDTIIIGAGMVRSIHTSTLEVFENVLGPTHTSLAKKKARLIFTDLDMDVTPGSPELIEWDHRGRRIVNWPGIFSASKLDVGTRCFLGALPQTDGHIRILDLGCGNGIVGLMAAADNPDAELVFIDESYGAVASAEATFRSSFPNRKAEFIVAADAADALDVDSVDLVLNNPPFHQNNALSDVVAWDMFQRANAVLRPGGEIWVVGNRHLKYHLKLQRIFGNCETMTGNPKFVVLRAEVSA